MWVQSLAPDTCWCRALSYPAGKVWCDKTCAVCGHRRVPPEDLQDALWERFFADPTLCWDNRGNKATPQHPDFKLLLWLNNWHKPAWLDSRLPRWDAGRKKPPECVSSSVQGQGNENVAAHEGHLEVAMCVKLCEDGWTCDAVDALDLLVQRGCRVDKNLFYRVLKWCIAHKDLASGRRIHALTVKSGYEGDSFLATHLIGLYGSHGGLEEAMGAFTKVAKPSAYNWATIIFAYAKHGQATQAIRLYQLMRGSTSVEPDNRIYVAVLKACAAGQDLVTGKEVHAHVVASPWKPDKFVQAGLVDMYAKCGSLEDARRVFDWLPDKTVVAWNAMLAGYAQQGMGEEAISLYRSMKQEDLTPSSVTYVSLLQACASVGVGALLQGKQVHADVQEQGLQVDEVLGGSLVNMYAKCGSIVDARTVFDMLPARNAVIWTTMIAGYAQQGMGEEALILYMRMRQEGLSRPDSVTYVCLLHACASVGAGALLQGKQLHAEIQEVGMQENVVVGGSLVNMYVKCGSLEDARSVFDTLPARNVVTWTAMVAGYAHHGMAQEALGLYRSMQQEGFSPPDSVTYVCLLQACASVGVGALHEGKQLHAQIKERGPQEDVVLGSSLVNMYAKCGSLENARRVFDGLPSRDVQAWNAILAGYAHQGMALEALSLYRSMQQEGLSCPDTATYVCLLQACASLGAGALLQGKKIHAEIGGKELQDDIVLACSLVNMYAKCGSLEDARSLFDILPARDVVTWTAMIAGYAQQGMGEEAISLYSSMQEEGLSPPDSVTYICLLKACASIAALPLGQQLHAEVEDLGLQADLGVGAAVVNMYAKCGSMFHAQQVFESLRERTMETWNALIGGYARQGDSEVVFDLLDKMRVEGMHPNEITFLSVLTVCSHAGLVDKGREYFEAMRTDYGISLTVEHFTCMMDLLGRAGHLDDALQMAKTMPCPPNDVMWRTLLGGCWKWKNVEIGQQAFEGAVSLDEKDAAAYVLMSNIYASAKMWEAAKEMQERRKRLGAWKKPGQSWWTDMGGVVHTFVVGEKKHSGSEVIYATLTS